MATGEDFSRRLCGGRELTAFVATPPRCQLPPPLLPMTLHVSAVAKHKGIPSFEVFVQRELKHSVHLKNPPPSTSSK